MVAAATASGVVQGQSQPESAPSAAPPKPSPGVRVGMNLLMWTEDPRFQAHRSIVGQIKGWGFDGVEFPIGPTPDEDIRAFAKQCDELGLGRTVIMAMSADTADPASSDPKLRQAAANEIKRMADKTKLLGADTLVGPLFQGLGRMSGKPPTDDERKWVADTIRDAGQYAAQLGVRLAAEPINRFEMYVVNTLADAAAIIKQVGLPNVGLLADTHHGNIEEKNLPTAWSEVAPLIFHVHISENDRGLPGSGHAIPPEVFKVLRRAKYNGWLTIEAFGLSVPSLVSRLHLWRCYGHNAEQVARLGLKFIRDNLAAA